MKKFLTAAAFAAAAWAGIAALSGNAQAHAAWPNPDWSEDCRISHYWYHSPYDHSPCEHRNWDYTHGGWHINDEPWWVWQNPYHVRYYHHVHHHRHHSYRNTKCWWSHEWKNGHRVSVKVCKTIYY